MMYCIIIKVIYFGFSGIFGIILYKLLIFNIILFFVVLKMTNSMSKSARNYINEILYKLYGFTFSIKRTEFNTIEVYWPSYSDNNANILLDIYKDKIKYLCKHRGNRISSIIFPSVCRLGRNTKMIEFVEWLFFEYKNDNINKDNIQIIFVSQKLVVNKNNFNVLKEQILNHLIISHKTIKTNLSLSGYSDDEKEIYYDEKINLIELHYDNKIKCNKTSTKSTIFINRHSSENISYIKKNMVNKLSVCNLTINQLLKNKKSLMDDIKCKSCQHPVGDHNNPENTNESDKDESGDGLMDETDKYDSGDDLMDETDKDDSGDDLMDESDKDESGDDLMDESDKDESSDDLMDDVTKDLSNLKINNKKRKNRFVTYYTDEEYHGNWSYHKRYKYTYVNKENIVYGNRERKPKKINDDYF